MRAPPPPAASHHPHREPVTSPATTPRNAPRHSSAQPDPSPAARALLRLARNPLISRPSSPISATRPPSPMQYPAAAGGGKVRPPSPLQYPTTAAALRPSSPMQYSPEVASSRPPSPPQAVAAETLQLLRPRSPLLPTLSREFARDAASASSAYCGGGSGASADRSAHSLTTPMHDTSWIAHLGSSRSPVKPFTVGGVSFGASPRAHATFGGVISVGDRKRARDEDEAGGTANVGTSCTAARGSASGGSDVETNPPTVRAAAAGHVLGGTDTAPLLSPREAAAAAAMARAAAPRSEAVVKAELVGRLREVFQRRGVVPPFGLAAMPLAKLRDLYARRNE